MSSNGTATDAAPSSQAPSPTPTPAPPASSNPPPAASSSPAPPPAASSSARPPAQSSAAAAPPASSAQAPAPGTTIRVTAAPGPASTEVQTLIITPTPSVAGQTPTPVIVLVTVTGAAASNAARPSNTVGNSNSADPTSTDPTQLQGAAKENSGGLSTGGKTAIAVVIPLVVVALLVLGALFFWRRRKQRKDNEDERRKEVEEYGYNPNHDPTLPAVGIAPQMAEDSGGYRGWGNTTTSSGRKASTTLTSGMTYSDSNSNPGGPNSPTHAYSDANSNDPLVNGRRETLDSDGIADLGAGPTAANNQAGVQRGPSNASSSYSAANHSDNSGDYPGMGNNPTEYYEQGYGSYQDGPYAGNNAYGAGQQPVIRDVSARRNTRIENPSVFPQQGNSGVSTNF